MIPPATPQAETDRRRWIALVVLCIGQLMIVLDGTVVNVALPAIQRELHFSQSELAWVVNAYLLTFGGLLLLAGRLGDLVGRSRIFLIGLAAFTVSSMLCGVAPTAAVLVAARFVQGASAAMVAAMVLGIIAPMFPKPAERTIALSVFAFCAVGGGTVGLLLGGVITELLNWHWIFFINLPVGVGALVAGRKLLARDAGIGIDKGADVLGALLVTSAPMLAVFGLVDAGSRGWSDPVTLGALAGSVALAGMFVLAEQRVATPLIPMQIFRHRNLVSATIVRALFPMGAFGLNFLGALYLQHVLGYSPLRTGLAFLPASLLTGVMSLALMPWMVRHVPLKLLVVSGLVLITAGMLALARAPVHAVFVTDILPTMVLTGAGFGLLFMPSVSIALSEVGYSEAGLASGLVNVAIQLGGAVGVALLATISASRTQHLTDLGRSSLDALAGGYRLGLLVGAGCTGLSLVAAVVLLRRPAATAAAPLVESTAAALAH